METLLVCIIAHPPLKRKVYVKTMLLDCHNHSRHSFDGKETVPDICQTAEALGLSYFALTDHCDMVGGFTGEFLRKAIGSSTGELIAYRESHQTRCQLLCGMELGDPLDNLTLAEEMLSLYPYDVVIGSVHTDGQEDYYFGDYRTMPQAALEKSLDEYFKRILRMVEWGKFDVLAHLTYPLRYVVGDAGRKIDLALYQDTIDNIFQTVIEKGLVLEVNVSGLRQSIKETLPGKELLKRYYALGGRLVTLGSDAHRCEDIGVGIDEGEKLLQEVGFTDLCWFSERKLRKIPLSTSLLGKNPV